MSVRSARLAALLLVAALILHEAVYAFGGGGLIAGTHAYLELLLPLAAALGGALALGSLLLPLLGRQSEEVSVFAPFAIALALGGIFVVQELVEALLLGGGSSGFAASLAVGWLVPPLALALGLLLTGLLGMLDRIGAEIAVRVRAPRRRRAGPACAAVPLLCPIPVAACSSLAFGFTRRPPPARR